MDLNSSKSFITLDRAASHTRSVKTVGEVITPIDEKYLPTIPADKLPTIPADKLPTIPVIEFKTSISANIAAETQPIFDVLDLSYSEIYNIAKKGSFLIADISHERYSPIKLEVRQSGDILVDIMVIGNPAIYAQLLCPAGVTHFSRNAWWQIEATRK